MRKFVTSVFMTLIVCQAYAQCLIPEPQEIKYIGQSWVACRTVDSRIDKRSDLPAEGYTLKVEPNGKVVIRAKDARGLIWAQRTLSQLKNQNGEIRVTEIRDFPAFAIRGFMHDTGRNFMDVEMLKSHIDLLSAYKLNVFQWHLTDNPGWRIQCKVYPELNDPKFQTRDYGKFYTYDEIRDVIIYARERGVMVMPEIDIPGHSAYFEKTFGFKMATPEGKKVLERCFTEFFTEIPLADCPYMHIGSDEVRIDKPKEFMLWAENMVKSAGRTAVAWAPGLPTDSTTVRQLWNGAGIVVEKAIAAPGPIIDSYVGYLNYYDPIFFVGKIYHHTVPARAQGGILCLWNDTRAEDKSKIPVHNGMLPGMLAFTEVFWRNPMERDFMAFEEKMAIHRESFLSREPFYYVPNYATHWDITINDTVKLQARGGAVDVDYLCQNNSVKVLRAMTLEARTHLYSPSDTTILAWIGFEAPARSNRISGGIAESGRWENDGNVMVNGVRVEPPVRVEAGKYKYDFPTWFTPENEIPYTDEQLYWMREPVEVKLRKGNNQILLIAPKVFSGQRWSFAFIPLTKHGGGRFSRVDGVRFIEQ